MGYKKESPNKEAMAPGILDVLFSSHTGNKYGFGESFDEPNDHGGGPLFSKFNNMVCSKEVLLEDDEYLLLPGYVLGYALGRKAWSKFAE